MPASPSIMRLEGSGIITVARNWPVYTVRSVVPWSSTRMGINKLICDCPPPSGVTVYDEAGAVLL